MSNRISHGLVNMFYVDPSDQNLAIQNLAPPQVSNSVHHSRASSSPTQGTMSNVASYQKLAHNVASHFKREDRYTGKIGEEINEFINNYCDAVSDYGLSTEQMLKYFPNVFDREAKRFFRSNVINNLTKEADHAILSQPNDDPMMFARATDPTDF